MGGIALQLIFALIFASICPITNGLNQNPIHSGILAGYVQASAFHFAADSFWLELTQLPTEIYIIH
jgi:hypothetical protein